jgi:hypothetical protein
MRSRSTARSKAPVIYAVSSVVRQAALESSQDVGIVRHNSLMHFQDVEELACPATHGVGLTGLVRSGIMRHHRKVCVRTSNL